MLGKKDHMPLGRQDIKTANKVEYISSPSNLSSSNLSGLNFSEIQRGELILGDFKLGFCVLFWSS